MRGGLVTILATAMACGVVACGGDDASDTTERANAEPTTGEASSGRPEPKPDLAESTADGVTPAGGPEKMLGGFGRVPAEAERARITAAVKRYHAAVAAHDDAWICAHVSRAARRAMTGPAPGASCVDQIDFFYSGHSEAMRKAVLDARIHELRVKGSHAIAIAVIPGPRTLKLPLERERGTWRYSTFGKWTPPSL